MILKKIFFACMNFKNSGFPAPALQNLADGNFNELLYQLNNIAPAVLLTKKFSGNLRNMWFGLQPQTFQPRPPIMGLKG